MRKLALFLCLVMAGCAKEAAPPEPIRPVKALKIAPSSATAALTLAGEVRARFDAPLAFRVGGKIVERSVNLGDTVRRGQLLGKLEATDYQLAADAQAAAVAGARTEARLTEGELQRYQGLREKGFISAAELDRRQAAADGAREKLRGAEAALDQSRRQVGYATLTADNDGIVSALDFNAGQVVAAAQPVLRLARPGTREIEVGVPESALTLVKAASGFLVTLNAQPGHAYPGKLRELSAAADPASRTYAARISVTAPPDALALNMSATVQLLETGQPAIRLPMAALVSRDGVSRVWKLDQASATVKAAQVTTSGISGNEWLVSGGLNPGDIVVTAGANLLREGQKVRVQP
ncbi:MAG: efflux RND transporter periplasmic adaptor subunit [Sulfuricella sp.]|nr:efflux RND transporter periplasmic adaptor subunit [Sulfuricella sp.]